MKSGGSTALGFHRQADAIGQIRELQAGQERTQSRVVEPVIRLALRARALRRRLA
jgi:hypothetical protein